MVWRRCLQIPAVTAVVVGCSTARPADDLAQLDAGLRHYADMVAAMSHDSIAGLFTADGELWHENDPALVGPDAILKHLRSFRGFQVVANELRPESTWVQGDAGFQRGQFSQRVRVPARDTIQVAGTFLAEWRRQPGGQWRMRRMRTTK